jgi:hypothetical protein
VAETYQVKLARNPGPRCPRPRSRGAHHQLHFIGVLRTANGDRPSIFVATRSMDPEAAIADTQVTRKYWETFFIVGKPLHV